MHSKAHEQPADRAALITAAGGRGGSSRGASLLPHQLQGLKMPSNTHLLAGDENAHPSLPLVMALWLETCLDTSCSSFVMSQRAQTPLQGGWQKTFQPGELQ